MVMQGQQKKASWSAIPHTLTTVPEEFQEHHNN